MKYLILILKGMGYGVTHIAPGLGGALVLILLDIYEPFVDAVGNFFVRRDRIKAYLSFLIPLGIGMVLGMLILARLITILLASYPAATMFFFMGLLIGTIPSVLKIHKDMRVTPGRIGALVLGIVFVVGIRAFEPLASGAKNVSKLQGIVYNACISFLAGGASVTPGLDGSYVLLLGGTYQAVVGAFSKLSELAIEWGVLVSTGIGAVVGIISFSKLIDTAIRRIPSLSYYCILGLILGALYGLWPRELAHVGIPILVLAFAAGLCVALLLDTLPKTVENPVD